ncbi:SLAM family member 6-like [Osmerus mordax]|uniref:SLAM family member 6-like n=1 Tax=Osmerus mordax TaxID=8014 RepID=UPI00350FA7C7
MFLHHLYIALALTTVYKQVYSEETPVFVLKGQDVRLEVKKHVNQDEIIVMLWKFNENVVVRYVPMLEDPVLKEYKNKAIFSKENFSLLIKNLQEADSGSYSVTVTRSVKEIKNLYFIVVQDKVDPPVLTVARNTFTADSCNMTVTCRTLNTSVSSTCNTTTCSQVGGDRGGVVTSTAPLLIYVSGGSIICNHSNQVSWAEDTKEIKGLCTLYPTDPPLNRIFAVTGSTIAVFLMCAGVYVCHYKKKTRTECINSTYDSVQNSPQAQGAPVDQSADRCPPTIYSTVQHPKPEDPETMEMTANATQLPNSIYAQVTKKTIRRTSTS